MIHSFLHALLILDRRHETILCATTGAAASNIGGSTFHSVFKIGEFMKINTTDRAVKEGIRVLLLDEVSMLGKTHLAKLHANGNDLFKVPADSDVVMGGIPIIVVLGDFKQFQPIGDSALWEQKGHPEGARVWKEFDHVLILTEQMRQKDDLDYQSFLERARLGSLTQRDVVRLNKQVITERLARGDYLPDGITQIVKDNETRATINRAELLKFAKTRHQPIFLFPAKTHIPVLAPNKLQIHEEILKKNAKGEWKGDGFFQYSEGMPVVLGNNVYTEGHLVNGTQGTIQNVAVEDSPNTKWTRLNDNYILCNTELDWVYFKPADVEVHFQHDNVPGGVRSNTTFCRKPRIESCVSWS